MSLLPSRGPDTSGSQDGELEIVGVDEDITAILDALSSETAREILNAVYEEPGTTSELADRLDMSIQKVSYHIEKLEAEELIAVAGTQYSEKGQEMKVFEPPEDPLVLFVGTRERKRSLRSLARRLLPVVGILTAASAVVQFLFGTLPGLFESTESASGGSDTGAAAGKETTDGPAEATTDSASDSGPEATPTDDGPSIMQETDAPESTEAPVEETPIEESTEVVDMAAEATETATTVASSGGLDLEPGVAFFLGGLLVVSVVTTMWLYSQ